MTTPTETQPLDIDSAALDIDEQKMLEMYQFHGTGAGARRAHVAAEPRR